MDRQRNLVGYSPWGHKESDTTEQLTHFHALILIFFKDPIILFSFHFGICSILKNPLYSLLPLPHILFVLSVTVTEEPLTEIIFFRVTNILHLPKVNGKFSVPPFLNISVKWSEVAQSCLTLCDPVDCSLPGFSVHGIPQARILGWVTISPGDLPDPGIKPGSPALEADALTSELPGKPQHLSRSQQIWLIISLNFIFKVFETIFIQCFFSLLGTFFFNFLYWLLLFFQIYKYRKLLGLCPQPLSVF